MHRSRRLAIKILAALTVFGAVFAMAATLTVNSNDLGAGSDVTVAACDTDGVTTSYTTAWDATDKKYEVTSVTVGGIAAACNGDSLKVTLVDTNGVSLGEGTLTAVSSDGLTDTSDAVTISPGASAEAATGVHVTIAG